MYWTVLRTEVRWTHLTGAPNCVGALSSCDDKLRISWGKWKAKCIGGPRLVTWTDVRRWQDWVARRVTWQRFATRPCSETSECIWAHAAATSPGLDGPYSRSRCAHVRWSLRSHNKACEKREFACNRGIA